MEAIRHRLEYACVVQRHCPPPIALFPCAAMPPPADTTAPIFTAQSSFTTLPTLLPPSPRSMLTVAPQPRIWRSSSSPPPPPPRSNRPTQDLVPVVPPKIRWSLCRIRLYPSLLCPTQMPCGAVTSPPSRRSYDATHQADLHFLRMGVIAPLVRLTAMSREGEIQPGFHLLPRVPSIARRTPTRARYARGIGGGRKSIQLLI